MTDDAPLDITTALLFRCLQVCRYGGGYPLVGKIVSWAVQSTLFESIAVVSSVVAPVLVMHGSEDNLVPVSHSRRLYEACTSAKKKLVVVEGAFSYYTLSCCSPTLPTCLLYDVSPFVWFSCVHESPVGSTGMGHNDVWDEPHRNHLKQAIRDFLNDTLQFSSQTPNYFEGYAPPPGEEQQTARHVYEIAVGAL